MKRLTAFLLTLLFIVSFSFADGEAWLTGWSHRKKITIVNTNVDGDLASFPVYVPIVDDEAIGTICEATGGDIRFTAADGDTELAYELVYFNVAATIANGDFYVLVNPVDHDAATVIYCYYDKNGETTTSAPTTVFNTANGWAAVWHLEEAAATYYDATANNNDSVAGTVDPDRVAGQSGYGQDFNGSSDWIKVADNASVDFADGEDMLITGWITLANLNKNQRIFVKRAIGGGAGYYLTINSSNYIQLYASDGVDFDTTNEQQTVSASTLTHVGISWDRSSATGAKTIKDGALQATGRNLTSVNDTSNAIAVAISNRAGDDPGDYYLDGVLDELRVMKLADITALPLAAWVKFEYYNMQEGHAAGNELTWGSAETEEAPSTYIPKVIIIQ